MGKYILKKEILHQRNAQIKFSKNLLNKDERRQNVSLIYRRDYQ